VNAKMSNAATQTSESGSVSELNEARLAEIVNKAVAAAIAPLVESVGAMQKRIDELTSDAERGSAAFPNAALPNAAFPNAAFPNVAFPNVAFPNAAFPNAAFPNAAFPNAALPNGSYGVPACYEATVHYPMAHNVPRMPFIQLGSKTSSWF
jgi:uncharacterized protein YjbI with pentapeptide repeats